MNHFSRLYCALLLATFSVPALAGLLSQRIEISDVGAYTNYEFGSTGVAISSDGTMFVVGEPGFVIPDPQWNDGSGTGVILTYGNGKWSGADTGWLSGPTTAAGYGTGLGISADGREMFFGFGISCLQPPLGEQFNCTWPMVQVINTVPNSGFAGYFVDPTSSVNMESNFGATGALSGDGRILVVGAPNATVNGQRGAGQVAVYSYAGGVSWSGPVIILDPAAAQNDGFGTAVALSADAHTMLVGGYTSAGGLQTPIVYVYRLNASTWTRVQTITGVDMCATCLALSANGATAIATTDVGANIYITTSAWNSFVTSPINVSGITGDGSVAMSADGNSVLIGTSGLVYQYSFGNGDWNVQQQFSDPGAVAGYYDGFGQTGVALSADKQTAVITAGYATVGPYKQAGLAYVYQSPADVGITGLASPSEVALNQQTTLSFNVTNHDPEVIAYNVVLADTLPAGFTGILTTPGVGASCITTGQTVTCTLPSLDPGATWSPSITATVSTAGNYTDKASVTSNQPDPGASNNSVNLSISMVPPNVHRGSLTVNADTAGSGVLTGTNPCGCGTLEYSVVEQPRHGTVTITDTASGAFTYTPSAGYIGSDGFIFRLSNGWNGSDDGNEDITVKDVPPTANSASVNTNVNQPLTGTLSAAPGYAEQTLSYSAVSRPAHGSVTVIASSGAYTYTPASGYIGMDSFTFTVGDGIVTSGAATVTIGVKDVPPTAKNGTVTTQANQPLSGSVSAEPGYVGQTLSYLAVTPPSHGTLALAASGTFTYTPDLGFVGADSFTFAAGDGIVSSGAATVSIAVQDIAPTVSNGSVTTNVNQPGAGTLSATPGYAGQLLSYAIVTQPTHGHVTLTASSGAFTYTPDNGYVGGDSFTFAAGDGIALSPTATVSVAVNDVAPTANGGSVTTNEGQAVSGTLSATPGYSGQALQYSAATQPAHGSVTVSSASGAFTYTPASGYSGSDSFTFTVGDGTVTSAAATESVTIKAAAGGGGGGGGGSLGLFGLALLGGLLGLVRRQRR